MKLVLVRHGQSEYNLKNIFTGWLDPHLSPQGIDEARRGGRLLKESGIKFDAVHTSLQSRAIETAFYLLEELDQVYLPVHKSWRLNERHYGALQGLNKAVTAQKYGEDQVFTWRRSYDVKPPLLDQPMDDPRYQGMDQSLVPRGESLKDCLKRVLPYWQDHLSVDLKENKNVLVAAHGNSLRSLIKYLEGIDDQTIPSLELATGQPIIYEFDGDLQVLNKTVLK
ncbi:2,3-diphosphoglycerate-dependent phosphoglycerate mutase [Hutsoniella sourekii]|uniref:2,3-diphosphoglycerate-dependent phosphoglycerate mutase n=1 Tax=Hutsoniella sourekii TaxID=87650 RepID=UPI0004868EFF|nr:2,3-diphosphoglycerate-dependent phosphoglycerate mutase [Hutsoniella sourekii]